MIISAVLLPTQEAPSLPTLGRGSLTVGDILTGRVTQLESGGRGVLRFPDGSGFTFANGPTLKPGEAVQVQVVRLTPDIGLRLLFSSSGVAASLAEAAEQSLVRAPDIFANLMNWSGLTTDSKSPPTGTPSPPTGTPSPPTGTPSSTTGTPSSTGGTLSPADGSLWALKAGSGGQTDLFMTSRGLTLAQVLQRVLPNVSAQSLLRGELTELVRLLENGSRQDVREVIQQLRQVAADLSKPTDSKTENTSTGPDTTATTDDSAELRAVRNTLYRLGDLVAMQEILPRTPLAADGGQLLGYRLFWLAEGGMGEAIWQRERQRRRKEQEDAQPEAVTSVLLSLNMTGLGAVQARIAYGDGQCAIGIAAEDEESLAALRRQVGGLRQALLAAELPLHSLELARLMPGEMRTKRMHSLGLTSQFATEA